MSLTVENAHIISINTSYHFTTFLDWTDVKFIDKVSVKEPRTLQLGESLHLDQVSICNVAWLFEGNLIVDPWDV